MSIPAINPRFDRWLADQDEATREQIAELWRGVQEDPRVVSYHERADYARKSLLLTECARRFDADLLLKS